MRRLARSARHRCGIFTRLHVFAPAILVTAGVSLSEVEVVGVTQRAMRSHHTATNGAGAAAFDSPSSSSSGSSYGGGRGGGYRGTANGGHEHSGSGSSRGAAVAACAQLPCFAPVPESQPVLPVLLRRLLQRGAAAEALALAQRHRRGHHFTRSLEWLLFTTLDWNSSCPDAQLTSYGFFDAAASTARRSAPAAAPLPVRISPLLARAADLVRSFPAFEDVVVSVARKTDASLWPALFTAVGSPGGLLRSLTSSLALEAAACFLIVVDNLEGPAQVGRFALFASRLTDLYHTIVQWQLVSACVGGYGVK